MSQSNSPVNPTHLRSAYIAINIILAAPVLLWPLPTLFFSNPMLIDAILPKWHLSIIIMLMACIAMDTILYGMKDKWGSINAILWLFVPSVLAVQNPQYTWLLAMILLAHSLRSGIQIFRLNTQGAWWLNIAWLRDMVVATSIFSWSMHLPA